MAADSADCAEAASVDEEELPKDAAESWELASVLVDEELSST